VNENVLFEKLLSSGALLILQAMRNQLIRLIRFYKTGIKLFHWFEAPVLCYQIASSSIISMGKS